MCQQRCEQESCGLEMVGREEREFPFRLIIIMGAEPTVVREREEPPEALDAKITSCIQAGRLKLSHQANVWALCRRLKENYAAWAIGEIHLDNDMVAGEVLEQLSMINFEKSAVPLKAITLSCNDIVCDNLKHLRVAYLGTLVMLHLDHNRIGSDGCFYISKTNLPRLQTLDLSHNLLNDSAVGHLANTNLPKLLHLNVNNNQIGVPGLYSLSRAEWPSLALCQIKENSFQPDNQLDGIRFRSEVKLFRLELR